MPGKASFCGLSSNVKLLALTLTAFPFTSTNSSVCSSLRFFFVAAMSSSRGRSFHSVVLIFLLLSDLFVTSTGNQYNILENELAADDLDRILTSHRAALAEQLKKELQGLTKRLQPSVCTSLTCLFLRQQQVPGSLGQPRPTFRQDWTLRSGQRRAPGSSARRGIEPTAVTAILGLDVVFLLGMFSVLT